MTDLILVVERVDLLLEFIVCTVELSKLGALHEELVFVLRT